MPIKCACGKRANFNYEGEPARFCKDCSAANMIDVKNKKCACGKGQPSFNVEGKKAKHCAACKTEDMIDVKNKKCLTPLCGTQVQIERYRGYCLRCFMHTYPDEPVARNYKTKERAMVDYIKEQFPDFTSCSTFDKSVGCSRKRPDVHINLPKQSIISECDENQHRDYDCSCENKRLMQLSQDLDHRPIVFIRFNPDGYLNGGKKISSCWKAGKDGIVRVKNEKEWKHRLAVLREQIQYWIDHPTDKTIEVVQLFFDC